MDSVVTDLAAPLPATHPVDQAHWKLYSSASERPTDPIEHNADKSNDLAGTRDPDGDT